jgi:Cu/Ag efflux pump CusA
VIIFLRSFLPSFLLPYKTYNSFKEASHVILAVPFASSGGVFLLKLLGTTSP